MAVLCVVFFSASIAAVTAWNGRGVGGGGFGLQQLSSLSWWYNWRLNPGLNKSFPQREYVAMVWGSDDVAELGTWTPHATTRHLLGFNEPNVRTESNMKPEEACQHWPAVKAAAKKHGLKVGSPAPAHVNTSYHHMLPLDWLDSFFKLPGCDTSNVDFIAAHWYGRQGEECNASDAVAYVKELHARYHKPIWLTEFSCGLKDKPVHKQLAFMKEILPMFDSMPDHVIARYAWFHAEAPDGASKDDTNDVLTEAGKLNSLGQHYNSAYQQQTLV